MSSNAAVETAVVQPRSRFGPHHRWTILGIGVAAQASFSACFAGIPVTGITMRAAYHLSNYTLGLGAGHASIWASRSRRSSGGCGPTGWASGACCWSGLLSTGAMLALMALAVVPSADHVPSVVLLAGCLLVVGALGGSVNGSSGRAVMAWFREGQRGFAMSIRQTAIPVGGALGTALLPWLAVSYGFRAVFGVLALFCFVTAAATWRWLHGPDELPACEPGRGRGGTVDERSPLRRWDVWRLALASGLLTVPQIGVLTFTAVFLHDAKHAGTLTIVLTLLVVQFGGAAARIWTGRYTDKHRNRRTVVAWIGGLAAAAMGCAAALTPRPDLPHRGRARGRRAAGQHLARRRVHRDRRHGRRAPRRHRARAREHDRVLGRVHHPADDPGGARLVLVDRGLGRSPRPPPCWPCRWCRAKRAPLSRCASSLPLRGNHGTTTRRAAPHLDLRHDAA